MASLIESKTMRKGGPGWGGILAAQTIMTVLALVLIWLAIPFHTYGAKIGYVDTSILMSQFNETKRSRTAIDSLNKDWQGKAKALKDSLDGFMTRMGSTYNRSSTKEQGTMKSELERRNQELAQYVKASQDRIGKKEKELMEPAIKKINAFLQELAAREKYDLIFGSTGTGNILAAGTRKDLTGAVITELNRKYP
jgi:Skp family chaperone for outer membrane proteins